MKRITPFPPRRTRFRGPTVAVVVLLACVLAGPAGAQTWLDFAHPDDPHVLMGDGSGPRAEVPLVVPELVQGTGDVVVNRPVLVVLMEWSDMTHRAVHDAAFWEDLVFGNPRAGIRPSVREIYRQSSNGRVILTPATAGDVYDGSADGVVGWVASDSSAFSLLDTDIKRAEAVRVADPFFDYHLYDTDDNGRVTTDELIVIAVFADNADSAASCEQHIGHPNPPYCVGTPGGNTRATNPIQVPVDSGADAVDVHQWVAGVGEMAHVEVVAHEIAHAGFGHKDLYPKDAAACTTYAKTSTGYTCDGDFFPPAPGVYSIMASYWVDHVCQMEPWGKIHLGFVLPKVITHDGTYSLYDAETVRGFTAQATQPEALIIFDPLRADPYEEYFVLENRNLAALSDQGMAVWLINESSSTMDDIRKVVRLVRRDDHWAPDAYALWDGASDTTSYDLTAASSPRNTEWTDGTASYIEVRKISAAGPVMTMDISMTPIFVDVAHSGSEQGTLVYPYNTLDEALNAIPEPPRTIRIAGGSYPGARTLSTPCRLVGWRNGTAVLGN